MSGFCASNSAIGRLEGGERRRVEVAEVAQRRAARASAGAAMRDAREERGRDSRGGGSLHGAVSLVGSNMWN